jgi:hypothetical protein
VSVRRVKPLNQTTEPTRTDTSLTITFEAKTSKNARFGLQ